MARFITRHQAWLFFPLLTLEGINLHVQAFAWLRRADCAGTGGSSTRC